MIPLDTAMWLVTAASLTATILNVKRIRWCFPIWFVTNCIWTWYNVIKDVPSEAGLSFAYVIIAIWGIWEWRKPANQPDPLGGKS
jgi:hypothetical protein